MTDIKGSINLVDCQILAHYKFKGGQFTLTLKSAKIAQSARAGQFVHIQVSDSLKMRRPISIMTVNKENNTFDLLYKVVGEGTKQLARRQTGDVLSVLGPIGNGFKITNKKRPLLIGGGVGMPPMIAIAQEIKDTNYQPLAILGSEVDFPFLEKFTKDKRIMPLLDEWDIDNQLVSLQGFKGVYKGYVTDFATEYLDNLTSEEFTQIEIYACGPYPMLKAVAKLAKQYNLPCQVSLEEYMACGVGGCAGCVVQTRDKKMKRVCVDGPVFNASDIFQ